MKTELELGLSLGTTSKTKPKTRFSIFIYEFFFQIYGNQNQKVFLFWEEPDQN